MIRQRVLLATVAGGAAKVVVLATNFFLTPFVLHRLGDAQYGLLVLVGSVMTQGALLDLGIKPAVAKYVAEHHAQRDYDRAHGVIATALSLYCVLGLVALLLAAAIAPFFPNLFNLPPFERAIATNVVLLMGIQLAILIPSATSAAVLWGLHRYALSNALWVVANLVNAATTVAVLLAGGGIIAMVAAGIPVTLGMQLITVWCVRRVAPELRFGFRGARRDFIKTVLSFSASTFVIETAYRVQTQIDEIVIGVFLPITSVTSYHVAQRLSGIPQMLAEQTLGAVLPLASQLHAEGDVDRLRALYLVGSRVTLAICVPLACVLIALAGPLLTLWVGAQYAVHAPIVVVLALASALEVSHWAGGAILQGVARHHGLAIASACAAVANLGLSILLVRSYGLMGVALATLIPAAAVTIGYIWPYTMRIVRVSGVDLLKQVVMPALAPALPMMGVLYGAGWLVAPSGLLAVGATAAAGLAIYAIVYMSFCAGDPERQLVRSVVDKLIAVRR